MPRLAFNRTVVLRYRIQLEQRQYAPATINLRLAAMRRVAYEAADTGLLSPELAAGIRRVMRRGHDREGALGRCAGGRPPRPASTSSPHTTCVGRAPVCAIWRCGELDQIQFLLGHVSIQTTERYLGCKQNLRCAVNDRLGIEPDAA